MLRVILKTDTLLKRPGEKGGKGEQGEPGVGERGEPGPVGPTGNNHSLTYSPDQSVQDVLGFLLFPWFKHYLNQNIQSF